MLTRLLLVVALLVTPAHANELNRERELLGAVAVQNADQNAWFHKVAGSFENDATRIQEALSRQKPAPQPPSKKAPPAPTFSMPIVLLFIATTLVFTPSVFRAIAGTLFGESGMVSGIEGIDPLHAKLPSLSAPELRLVTGVLVSRILKDDPTPPVLALLKDVMAFLTTYRADAAVEPVLEGALAGIRDQSHHLSIDEKATVLAAVTRWVTGSYDERQVKPAFIAPAIGEFVQYAVGRLDEAGFSRDEQAALAGEIVKGSMLGMGDAGLTTAAEITGVRGVVKHSLTALAQNDVYPEAVSPAVDGIMRNALVSAAAPQYSTRQLRRALAGVLLGMADGLQSLHAKKSRSLASDTSNDEAALLTMIERYGSAQSAVRAMAAQLESLSQKLRESAAHPDDGASLRDLSGEALVNYQRLKTALENYTGGEPGGDLKQKLSPAEAQKANAELAPFFEAMQGMSEKLERP